MVSGRPSAATVRLARHLGLKAPILHALQQGLAQGEYPIFLRTAEPALAGQFPHAFGFEVLLERLRRGEALERRRANLQRLLAGKQGQLEASALSLLETTMDEGQLDDLSAMIQAMPRAPKASEAGEAAEEGAEAGGEAPQTENEEEASADPREAFRRHLECDPQVAAKVQATFLADGTFAIVAREGSEEAKRFASLLREPAPLSSFDPALYLHLRRGEKAHALQLEVDLPAKAMGELFNGIGGYPAQEKESYRLLFQEVVRGSLLPKFVQRMRAQWKQLGEDIALQQGWEQVERALDRGHHQGPVLGVSRGRRGRLIMALDLGAEQAPAVLDIDPKAEDASARLAAFLGEKLPQVVGLQADSATRNVLQKLIKTVEGWKPRLAMVPLAVVKTMLREVARRPFEALLGHEERQAFLTAELTSHPRAAAFHTPHIVRAFVPHRSEINPRLLDEFETTFLRSLLAARGADANQASLHMLSLVPGLDAAAAVVERSTAPYRSLEDLRLRLGLEGPAWRAAACLLRVHGGDEPLDAKALHPCYYGTLRRALAKAELSLAQLLQEPEKFQSLDWSEVEPASLREGVARRIRAGLFKAKRGRSRPVGGAKGGRRLESLRVGESFTGKVRSLADYGAFVDIGAERDGLVHVSQCAPRFLKHPSEALEEGQELEVRILEVDLAKRKIRLTALSEAEEAERAAKGGRNRESRGGGREGAARSGGGRPGGGRGPRGRGRGRGEDFGPDPRAKKEEFDPTNPFYVFFKQQEEAAQAAEQAEKGAQAVEKGTQGGE